MGDYVHARVSEILKSHRAAPLRRKAGAALTRIVSGAKKRVGSEQVASGT